VTLPKPGQWVRVRHACPDVTHDEPVEVVAVLPLLNGAIRITTRRCDGLPMNVYEPGDLWEIEAEPDTCPECWVVRPCFCDEETQ
jgi:hypothetical protein